MEQQPPIERFWLDAKRYPDGKIVIDEYHHRETYDENALEKLRAPETKPIARRAYRVQKLQLLAAILIPLLVALLVYYLNH